MPTPSSGNPISFLDIANEFGFSARRNLGAYRISQNVGTLTGLPLDTGIPQSVAIGSSSIRFSNFYDKRLNIVVDYTYPFSFSSSEIILPNSVVSTTNLSANINNLNEGVDNFNGVYATNTALAQNTFLVLGFPTPPNVLQIGANLQTFRARVRKNAAGGNTTTVRIRVRENGGITLDTSSTFTITSTTGENISFTWDASILNSLNGADVEIVIEQVSGGTGSNRRWIEIDTADWIATLSTLIAGGKNGRQIYNEGIYNVVIGGASNGLEKEVPIDPSQNYKITINLNTEYGANKGARTNCAFRTGDWKTGTGDALTTLRLELGPAAILYGAGGDGGNSNTNHNTDNVPDPNPDAAGLNGTSALGIDYPTTVINRGRIQAGGGGGGAGGSEFYRSGKSNRRSTGGGGGGGAGYEYSGGGLSSTNNSGGGNQGSNGQRGSFQTAGNGGAGGANSGAGGAGGVAAPGSAGQSSNDQQGGAGGVAGWAVVIASSASPTTPPIQNLVDGIILGDQTIDTPTTNT